MIEQILADQVAARFIINNKKPVLHTRIGHGAMLRYSLTSAQ
jgi:hypothetical protein